MQEAHIDHSELDRLAQKLAKSPQVIKKAKSKAFQTAAPKLKASVQTEIGGSGRVRFWQEGYVGSKGGYAAARPKARTFATDHKGHPTKYAVGHVTRAIDSGHRWPAVRMGQNKGLKGFRVSTGRVPGKHFYQRAQAQAEQVAQETAQQIVQALTDHLGG